MKDFKDIIKVTIVLGTVLFNAFLVYILLFNPFSQLLLDKNQPYHEPPPNKLIQAVTMTIIALLIISTAFLLVRVFKKQQIFVPAPLLTILVTASLIKLSFNSLKYPDATSRYTQDGYYYKIEVWRNTPDDMTTYKRWKSKLPWDKKSEPDDIKYKIDSVAITREGIPFR